MTAVPAWIREKAAETLQPAQVENTLERVSESWPGDAPPLRDVIEQFPLGEASLLHLLSVSSICAAQLARHPDILLWLSKPEICSEPRSHRSMLTDLQKTGEGSTFSGNFGALRFWKGREMLRIALREVAEAAPLEETTLELSHLAEICLREVYTYWDSELRSRRGGPDAQFAILGLGKLGGRELNHSSDIDVIFLYDEEGQVSPNFTYHEWFNQLGAKIIETFAAHDPAGALFRIDLRLRPEGTAGPLARSLESMENYYAGFGETWERLALIKARGIAGSRELAYEFLRQHQPFIFPRSPTPDVLEEIAGIKRRIERDIVGHEKIGRDVKLGAGGIREIEFVVQALQLLHGARHAFLQETSTLKALPVLAELELLPRGEARLLESGYRFLRRVEHRLQIEAEQQTHTVPENPEALRRLARSLGFPSPEKFNAALREEMQQIRGVFRRVISSPSGAAESAVESLHIFRDEKAAAKSLADLAKGPGGFHVAPRTRQVLRNLRPLLFRWLARAADPDVALNQFIRFVEAYGLRSMLFELLVVNPKLLELLLKTFDASRHAGDLLIRRPQLLEEITRAGMLDREVDVAQHLQRLEALEVEAKPLDSVRAYRQIQLLRIFLRDVLGLASLASLFAEHSALAEACLIFMNRMRGSESDLTIIALGKFGGAEIGYGADLDVLFVGDDIRAAQHLVVAMAQPTAEGSIATLDARLRPEGEKGSLACSLATYEAYYETRAQLWEIQALTRARPVAGPLQNQFMDLVRRVWRKAAKRDDLYSQIAGMLRRIRQERGSAADVLDFKTGTGGVIEAEFLVQALQMRADIWNPHTMATLDELSQKGLLPKEEATLVKESYEYLRLIESVLRRWENKSVSILPVDEPEQRKLAKRIGADSLDSFAQRYREARESIHSIASRHLR
ncbi:MAG TPA: bifunctional [glutamate--ammonia ligase]-adenylyl-L-tyrosine phosphorylase/[glutamate--ammonia-ligase] adenylyltransferase [Chthoniobacterales bacterium]|nr:bifunctional [glutamate--ammonia ligase]-adenylyl-L-tyrosine phosphorylase/[glutamate--ammonia-ligase] adenylyltransferase [Chthoniobacterales bacterium]